MLSGVACSGAVSLLLLLISCEWPGSAISKLKISPAEQT